jgi:peptidoglycan/LPS O-acetylase OafA/YrhL
MPSTSPSRLTCLDGLRGALAFYVMSGHLAVFVDAPGWSAALPGFFAHGQAAVDMFFMLSGLVITNSLARYRGRPGKFLAARAARIYPAYLVAFLAALCLMPLPPVWDSMPWIGTPPSGYWPSGLPPQFVARLATHLTMTHGLLPNAVLPYDWVSLLPAAWSLSTEWQFYAVLACFAARGEGAEGRLAALLLLLALAGQVWARQAPEAWQFSRAFLPNKAQYFALGIASAALVRNRPGARSLYLATLAACLALTPGAWNKLLPPLAWTIVLGAELGMASLAPLASVLRHRALQWLGGISYSLYVIHAPVQKLAGNAAAIAARGSGGWFDLLFVPAAAAFPLAAAAVLHRTVETRWMRLAGARAAKPFSKTRSA